jgi:hypothetical protein
VFLFSIAFILSEQSSVVSRGMELMEDAIAVTDFSLASAKTISGSSVRSTLSVIFGLLRVVRFETTAAPANCGWLLFRRDTGGIPVVLGLRGLRFLTDLAGVMAIVEVPLTVSTVEVVKVTPLVKGTLGRLELGEAAAALADVPGFEFWTRFFVSMLVPAMRGINRNMFSSGAAGFILAAAACSFRIFSFTLAGVATA